MSFDWKEYIKLAEELLKQVDEAHLRSSISRAYYGVFCIARNKSGYKRTKATNVHKSVILHYQRSHNLDYKFVGKLLDELRRNRNDADYNEDKVIDLRLAERVLAKSSMILEKL